MGYFMQEKSNIAHHMGKTNDFTGGHDRESEEKNAKYWVGFEETDMHHRHYQT